MTRIEIVLCLCLQVICGFQIKHQRHSHHAARYSRSSTSPSLSGYMYNNHGDTFNMYPLGSTGSDHSSYAIDEHIEHIPGMINDAPSYSDLSNFPEAVTKGIPYHFTASPSYNSDYEISRMKADSMADYLRSNAESDMMLQKLKSLMYYAPSESAFNDAFVGYDVSNDFQNDDDDVRSSGGTMYDSYWPYLYHNTIEYEHKDISNTEKAKDKRFVTEIPQRVIPIHEYIENDVPMQMHRKDHVRIHTPTPNYFKMINAKPRGNPINGDGPFFSFVLNDYYDKNKDEDPLTFKGLAADWGKDFDHESYRPLADDMPRKIRRLDDYTYRSDFEGITTVKPMWTNGYAYPVTEVDTSYGKSTIENGHRERQHFDKHEKGENKNSTHQTSYNNGAHQSDAFKKIIDSFVNKFGSEDHKKNSNYIHKINKDNGEKKKGFRKVYHKDEFQEDNEFYDNFNNSMKAEDKGSVNAQIGGSEGLLGSHASANLKNIASTASDSGNSEDKKFTNSHSGNNVFNKEDKLHKYIDVAKEAARSNSADYLDHYKV